jgi:uncharacterized protein YndB with AHSA1/START domain
MDTFEVSSWLPAPPEVVYVAWLDSAQHAAFVGAQAEIEPKVGGDFRMWDGYISGRTLTLDPPRGIVQSWRTTDFPDGSPDSRLEVEWSPRGSADHDRHSEIPSGQGASTKEGWRRTTLNRWALLRRRGVAETGIAHREEPPRHALRSNQPAGLSPPE